MASWQLIASAGSSLVALVEQHVRNAGLSDVSVRVASASAFKPLAGSNTPTITFFLYRVAEMAELRNAGRQRTSEGSLARQPLPLELCYLVTACVKREDSAASDYLATEEEHKLLGLVMQALYDHAEVGRDELVDGSSPVWGRADSLQVVLDTLPIEDQYRIWDATDLAYRLSIAYRVRVLGLEPAERQQVASVSEARFAGGEA